MKKVLLINCILLIFALSVLGQKTNSDLKQLQKEIGSSAPITANDISFPVSKPVKIFLAIKHNKNSAKDFANWVGKWNRENAAKYGELQIVDKLEDADIAAVQFQNSASRVVREEAVKLKVGTVQRDDSNNINKKDKFVLNSIGNSNVRAESSAVNLKLPLYSYLIVRDHNSSWAVDYSRVDERLNNKIFPELLLQSAIEDRLKDR